MIQEPALYPQSGLPMANPNWIHYLPSSPPPLNPESPTSPPRYRCVTYVSRKIKSHLISQVNSHSSLVVALRLTLSPSSSLIHIINAYLPPLHQDISHTLSPALTQATSGPIILGMDSNLHHPTWNPPMYPHTHKAADDLILLAATHHLTLRSEIGIPTFYATSNRQANTTINPIWMNEEAHDLATSCTTDTSLEHSYSSDHAAILATIDLPTLASPLSPPLPRLNWKKADEPKLSSCLSRSISPLADPSSQPRSREEIDSYVDQITQAINSAISSWVPVSNPPPNARRWWNEAVLGPMKRKSSALRRKYQLYKSEDNKAAYLSSAKAFHHAILRLKHEHWKTFLGKLNDKSLFTAAPFTEGPPPTALHPPFTQLGLPLDVQTNQAG